MFLISKCSCFTVSDLHTTDINIFGICWEVYGNRGCNMKIKICRKLEIFRQKLIIICYMLMLVIIKDA